jgi:hypothetical protein
MEANKVMKINFPLYMVHPSVGVVLDPFWVKTLFQFTAIPAFKPVLYVVNKVWRFNGGWLYSEVLIITEWNITWLKDGVLASQLLLAYLT